MSLHFCGLDGTAELILRTIISVSQLSVNEAAADMRDELAWKISGCSESAEKPVAQNNSETTVTELSTTNKTPRTNETVQGNLLHEYEWKFANLPDHLQFCSNAGIAKTVPKGQYFTILDDAELDKLGDSCRQKTFTSRRHIIQKERMDPWEHQDRSSLERSSQSPSRPLRNRDHDQLLVWRRNSFQRDDREWNQQIRDGNLGGNPREPH